jgi:dienelactone hydrolase
LWGCGDNVHPPALAMHISNTPPAYGEAPFPTDAVREGPTLGVIRGLDSIFGQHDDLIAAHLAQLSGWGLRPAIEFFIQGAVDPATVPAHTDLMTDSLVVLDVDPNTPEHDSPLAFDWRYDAARSAIIGVPSGNVNLKEGVRYAAVITRDIKGVDGQTLVSGQALEQLTHGPPDRWKTTADAYNQLAQSPALKDRIAGLTVFTTQQATDALANARESDANTTAVPAPAIAFPDPSIIFDTPAKLDSLLGHAQCDSSGPRAGLEQWGLDNPTGIAHAHVAVVASGTMQIGRFRRSDTGTNGAEDGTFEIGAYDVPMLQSVDTIPVTVILPTGTPPPNGFPTVIFCHGLGGSRHDALNLAEPLTSKGFAIVAIDMWAQGSRYNPTDVRNNLGDTSTFTGDPNLRDGFGDPTGIASYLDYFENFLDIGAIRDSTRQSVLDQARVAMLIQAKPDLSALAAPYGVTPKLDPAHVAFLGESFGALVGAELAAIEPSIDLYILNGAGGGMIDLILPNSNDIGSIGIPYSESLYKMQGPLDPFHPAISMMQAIVEAGDSLSYAPHVLKNRLTVDGALLGNRSIVIIQAVLDETTPAVSTYALARNLGVAVLEPDLDPPSDFTQVASPTTGNVIGQTGVLVQYEPATSGHNWSALQGQLAYLPGGPQPGSVVFPKLPAPININEPIYATQAQVAQLLQTHLAGMVPVVQSTQTPVADFDDDGVPDKMDPYPYDPTR